MRKDIALSFIETLVLVSLVTAVGLFFPGDPRFERFSLLPQIGACVIAAVLFGLLPGLTAFALAALYDFFAIPAATSAIYGVFAGSAPSLFLDASAVPAIVALGLIVAAGVSRDSYARRSERLIMRFRDSVRKRTKVERTSTALIDINRELESRVSTHRESITTLYAQIQLMDNLELDKSLEAFVQTVALFSQATKLSVWEYEKDENVLIRRAGLGWIEGPEPGRCPVDGTIEGWVFRNASFFSLRMINEYGHLKRMDRKRNLMTFPIRFENAVWGVLNLEEMPFFRYNIVVEKNLAIIVNLAEPAIKRAVEFRERVETSGRNAVTGLGGYRQFMGFLGGEATLQNAAKGKLSIVIVDILNYEELAYAHSGPRVQECWKSIVSIAERSFSRKPPAFHYKDDSQVAFALPGVDHDGASLFCFELLNGINERQWAVNGEKIMLEVAFGFAASKDVVDAPALLSEAEGLLAVSKSVFSAREA